MHYERIIVDIDKNGKIDVIVQVDVVAKPGGTTGAVIFTTSVDQLGIDLYDWDAEKIYDHVADYIDLVFGVDHVRFTLLKPAQKKESGV